MRKPWVLLLWVVAVLFAAGGVVTEVHAQNTNGAAPVFGQVRVTVPFEFYAGDTQFPAGDYVIKRLNENDPSVLTVQPVNGKATAILLVQLQDNKVQAKTSDVSFNKYGTRYFISAVTVDGYSSGSMVQPSPYENLVAKGEVRGQGRIVKGTHK